MGALKSKSRNLRIAVIASLYCFAAWAIHFAIQSNQVSVSSIYWLQLAVFAVLLVFYTHLVIRCLRYSSTEKSVWHSAAILALILPLIIPSVMQTDQIRYIWDGANLVRRLNPYGLIPLNQTEFQTTWWVGLINHPSLPTIYPPFAEVLFGLGSALNPFFWRGSSPYFDITKPTNLWQLEFGHSLIIGIFSAWLVYLSRKNRYELWLGNPLTLICIFANKHIEGLLLPFFFLLLKPSLMVKHRPWLGAVSAMAIAIKFLPIFGIPFLVRQRILRGHRTFAIASALLTLCFFYSFFSPDIFYAMQSSLKAFVRHWHFFAFGFQFLGSMAENLKFDFSGIEARAVATMSVIAWLAFLILRSRTKHHSVKFSVTWFLIGFFAMFPTLHPWYLSSLLIVGFRFFPALWTPVVWPTLAFASQSYYIGNQINVTIYLIHYSIVTVAIVHDLVVSRTKLFNNHGILRRAPIVNHSQLRSQQ